MSRPRILFRADASFELGFGHVARMWALIEEVNTRNADAIALFGGDPTTVTSWARDRGLTVDVREWSPSQVAQEASDPRVTAIVIDGPALVTTLVPKLADHPIRTIVIDDGGRCGLDLDAVINHNFHAASLAATYPRAGRRLLGRRYLLLRRDIRRYTRGSCRPMCGARLRVVISYGGSDPVGATARTLGLLPDDRPLELVVIAGPGFRDDEALRTAAAHASRLGHTVDIRRAPADPGALFVSADAAVCSAGGTLGELAYLGCPALAYAIVPDQVAGARHQVREGLIAAGRTFGETDDDTLRADLGQFLLDDAGRQQQRQRALATADSDGPRRVVDEAILPA